METWKDYQKNFWKKYLFLEEKLIDTEKYVSFDDPNMCTYSHVFEELLVVICSEIEAVLKEWTGLKKGPIKTLLNELFGEISESFDKTVYLKLTEIELRPFEDLYVLIKKNKNENDKLQGFDSDKHLKWWTSYNNIKHNKAINKQEANLRNVLNSLAALYILESLRIKDVYNEAISNNVSDEEIYDCPYKPSQLFDSNIETINYIDSSGNTPMTERDLNKILNETN